MIYCSRANFYYFLFFDAGLMTLEGDIFRV